MFESLSEKFTEVFQNIKSYGTLSQKDIDVTLKEIRSILVDADVSLSAIDDFIAALAENCQGLEATKTLNPAQQIIKQTQIQLEIMLGSEISRELSFAKNPPTVFMLAGLQGSGKTTFAGKLALYLKEKGNTPLLVAADLQRPDAVTQLKTLGESINVPVYAPETGASKGFFFNRQNPVTVAKNSIKFAKDKQYNVVIIDTAGRLGVDEELIKQARDIKESVQPDESLFVIDSMTGQDAAKTAQAFAQGVGISGIVLTKLDGDARGGAALSVVSQTKKPILFSSTGEKLTDISPFYPDRMASRILDLGDMMSLIEQAEKISDSQSSIDFTSKIENGEKLDLNDFLDQLGQIKKLGSMQGILNLLPGSGKLKQQIGNVDDGEFVSIEAMIKSMTNAERANPKIINGSRKARIAKGSGTSVNQLNRLLDNFAKMQKMMSGGGLDAMMGQMGLPGGSMGGIGANSKKNAKKNKKKNKGSKSGNPAKRALESQNETLERLRNR